MSPLKIYLPLIVFFVFASFSLPLPSASAQVDELLSIAVDAGFDGFFRPNAWVPLRVELSNQGDDIQGHIVVRPETSGSTLPNTFSTPVDLPEGSTQAFFLYISIRGSAGGIRVELLNNDNLVLGSRDVNLRDILPRDTLHVVVSQSASGSLHLSEVKVGGYNAYQALWAQQNIPDRVAALDPVNMMVFSDVDSGKLTPSQVRIIESWVIRGGHLIVTGGVSWQATAAGLSSLLPLIPNNTTTTSDLTALAELAGKRGAVLSDEAVVAMGELVDGAVVLAENEAGIVLAARRYYGNGRVDYLSVDPNTQPIRNWDEQGELWFSLATMADARPSWSYGFSAWDRAASAVEILPGLNLLPAVVGLIGFLLAYIGLVGPLNYFVLWRLNRLEYAWATIPILIIVFSALARSFGVGLRGTDAALSRLTVIQTWPDTQEARIDQLLGLLAPRRGDYSLRMTDERMMRPFSASLVESTILGHSSQGSINIRQSNQFEAVDFPVDASFVAAFATNGTTERPDIGGQLTLSYNERETPIQTLRGSIRNDSEITLYESVILARGTAYRLNGPFAPGDLLILGTDQLTLSGQEPAVPSSLEYAAFDPDPFSTATIFGFRAPGSRYVGTATRSAIHVLGEDNYIEFDFSVSLDDDEKTQEIRRRQAFINAFMVDQFASTARGNRAYLVGWAEDTPTQEAVGGADFNTIDTTLFIVELDVEVDKNPGNDVLITMDQFTWTTRKRVNINDTGPTEINLPGESMIIYRFSPLPDAVLDSVDEMILILERNRQPFGANSVDLFNWEEQVWETIPFDETERISIRDGQRYSIMPQQPTQDETDPSSVDVPTEDAENTPRLSASSELERFLGPMNAVEVRISRHSPGGSLFINSLGIEQRGKY